MISDLLLFCHRRLFGYTRSMHVHCTVAVAAVVVVVTVATQLGVCARLQRAQAPERRGQHVYICCCLVSFVRFFFYYRCSFEVYKS